MKVPNGASFDANFTVSNNDINQLQSLAKNLKTQDKTNLSHTNKYKEADEAAKQFETLFMDMMIKNMRETAKPEDESNAQGIYKDMLDKEYSKSMTDAQSFGIRDMVRQWILENQS